VEERRRLVEVVSGLAEAHARLPLEPDGWSVHNILAHRLFWEGREVEAIGQHLLGRRVELLDFPGKRLAGTNAAAITTMDTMSSADLLRDLTRTRAALIDLVHRLTDEDLNTPDNDARTVLGIALSHDREHATQIHDWRIRRSVPAPAD
jgi:hypothetical protein